MSSPMSLTQAEAALSDSVTEFYNYMIRSGNRGKEMPAHWWAHEFRSWLNPRAFEQRHEDTILFLKEEK